MSASLIYLKVAKQKDTYGQVIYDTIQKVPGKWEAHKCVIIFTSHSVQKRNKHDSKTFTKLKSLKATYKRT